MIVHREIERPTDSSLLSGRLHVVLADQQEARVARNVVADVVGRRAAPTGTVGLNVDGVDGRAAVDLLAELAWAGVVPIAFSLR